MANILKSMTHYISIPKKNPQLGLGGGITVGFSTIRGLFINLLDFEKNEFLGNICLYKSIKNEFKTFTIKKLLKISLKSLMLLIFMVSRIIFNFK